MAAKKILMLLGDFVEDYEVMVPFQALTMLGHVVHTVCPHKKAGDKIKTAIHDFEGHQTYTEKPGHDFVLNANFSDVQPDAYDAVMIPGGRSAEYLRLNERVLQIVRHFAETNKPIAAICHGLQLMTAAGIVKGRACSSYQAVGPEITMAGGKFIDIAVDQAHVDGNFVTAPAWPAQAQWLAKFLQVLGTKVTL